MTTACESSQCSNTATHITVKGDETLIVCRTHADGEHVREIGGSLPFFTAHEFLHRPLDKE